MAFELRLAFWIPLPTGAPCLSSLLHLAPNWTPRIGKRSEVLRHLVSSFWEEASGRDDALNPGHLGYCAESLPVVSSHCSHAVADHFVSYDRSREGLAMNGLVRARDF